MERLPKVEGALEGARLSPKSLCAALCALRGQDASAGALNLQLVQGMLLSALAPLLQDQVRTGSRSGTLGMSCCCRLAANFL